MVKLSNRMDLVFTKSKLVSVVITMQIPCIGSISSTRSDWRTQRWTQNPIGSMTRVRTPPGSLID